MRHRKQRPGGQSTPGPTHQIPHRGTPSLRCPPVLRSAAPGAAPPPARRHGWSNPTPAPPARRHRPALPACAAFCRPRCYTTASPRLPRTPYPRADGLLFAWEGAARPQILGHVARVFESHQESRVGRLHVIHQLFSRVGPQPRCPLAAGVVIVDVLRSHGVAIPHALLVEEYVVADVPDKQLRVRCCVRVDAASQHKCVCK